jgi:type IV pilus assembly protein PilW
MVALLLGSVLSAVMVGAYLAAKRHYHVEEQMARIQENARFAIRLLTRELTMAGFHGGLPVGVTPAAVNIGADCGVPHWALDSANSLDLVNDYQGTADPVAVQSGRLTCLDSTGIAARTDLLAIKRTAAGASVRRGVPAGSLTESNVESWYLRVRAGRESTWERLSAGDLREPARLSPTISYWEAIARILFVRRADDAGDAASGIPALCMETLAGNGMTLRCLVEGVENMQFQFGIDTDGDGTPNRYLSEPVAGDLQRAVSARVHLLVRSPDQITGYRDDHSYLLGAMRIAPRHDAYLRRVFSWTVQLRNHLEPFS